MNVVTNMYSRLYAVGCKMPGRMITAEKLTAIQREINTDENVALFATARCRHPALVEHESIDSVLAALANKSRRRNMEKDAITRAMVCEHQEHPHPFWLAILIAAYIPMLMRLCGRIRSNENDPKERLQLVVAAFIEVIASIPSQRPWICISLRRRTEGQVFQYLSGERRQRRVIGSIEALEPQQHEAAQKRIWEGDPLWPFSPPERHRLALEPDEREVAINFLVEHAGRVLSDEDLELVITTCVHGERLTDHVRRCHPDLDEVAQRREYERLKRRHSRALAKLRDVLATRWEHLKTTKAEAEAEAWPGSLAASR